MPPEFSTDADTVGVIEVKLRDVNQLFNSIDPSPFHDKDLDHDAEEFIVSWARQFQPREPLRLVVHLESAAARDVDAITIENAVQNYFVYRTCAAQRAFSLLLKQGRVSLAIGVAALGACALVGELIARWSENPAFNIVRESLLIGGWVAMWRPIEIFLYDWWPVRNMRRLYERLSRMPVEIRVMEAAPVSASPLAKPNGVAARGGQVRG